MNERNSFGIFILWARSTSSTTNLTQSATVYSAADVVPSNGIRGDINCQIKFKVER